MNTAPKACLSLTATFLGPVLSLSCVLAKNAQCIIFARNGIGKSFITRALRYLDLHGQNEDISNAARDLVSDESIDGAGAFSISRGSDIFGSLQLDKKNNSVTAQITDTIFHVFSEDFVHEQLRERLYQIDGQIDNQITIDSDIIKLRDSRAELDQLRAEERERFKNLEKKLLREKAAELQGKAAIRNQLRESASLNLENLIEHHPEKPSLPPESFTEILKDLDRLKSIPAEPKYPTKIERFNVGAIDFEMLKISLERVTSPSSVAEDIKGKIEAHPGFYKTGTDIVQAGHRTSCPFCEQEITQGEAKILLDAYIAYFADAEEKHKAELRRFLDVLNNTDSELTKISIRLSEQKVQYDSLKLYVPSRKSIELSGAEEIIREVRSSIDEIKDAIARKASSLSTVTLFPEHNLTERTSDLDRLIDDNNAMVEALNVAVRRSDVERVTLQRKACAVFECEFSAHNWTEIEAIRRLRESAKDKEGNLLALEKALPTTDARIRVAETFETLLRELFSDKYVFNKQDFTLKRGDHEMTRGPHRTLSEGEKTVIAFCYFIASVHRKVRVPADYKKLFLVFDDPVTSMSYDFVFAIAQVLKNLNVSMSGDVSINPSRIDGNKHARPNLLIFTHSSYFFNISVTNRIIDDNAAFALYPDGEAHKIERLNKYVAPFQEQLRDVYEIANGRRPDHHTASAIRSVLEAVGRFCRPDKSDSLVNFVTFLASDGGILIKSVLINSLCHGSYYDETPSPDDIRLACKETISVVEKFAAGQLELIKGVVTN